MRLASSPTLRILGYGNLDLEGGFLGDHQAGACAFSPPHPAAACWKTPDRPDVRGCCGTSPCRPSGPCQKMACLLLAMPTTFSFSPFCCISFGCWMRICSNRLPPTVPTPAMKRFNTLYWERKKESWIEFNALRRYFSLMTKEMFVSEAPCAQAITLIPALPSVPNNLPAIPGVRFMFSPTIATVATQNCNSQNQNRQGRYHADYQIAHGQFLSTVFSA